MADPTVTPDNLADALRVKAGDTPLTAAQTSILARVHASAVALVTAAAPDAPVAVANEAVIRLAGWLYDTDPAQSTRAATDPMQRSGAAALLARWRPQSLRGASGTAAAGTGGTGGTGEAGVDATARAAAATARAEAMSAAEDADQAAMAAAQALARVPAALPAPAVATRGHALAQDANSEAIVFRSGGEANDGVARASAAANAAKVVGLEAEIDNAQQRIEDLGKSELTFTDKSILSALGARVDHTLADSTRVYVHAKVGAYADGADLSGLTWALMDGVGLPSGAVYFALRVPSAIVRTSPVTSGRLALAGGGGVRQPIPFRDFSHHSGGSGFEYFTTTIGESPIDNHGIAGHFEDSALLFPFPRIVPNVVRGAASLIDHAMLVPADHGGFTRDTGLDIETLPDGWLMVRATEPNGDEHSVITTKAALLALGAVAVGASGVLSDSVSLSGGTPHGFTGFEVGRLTGTNNLWFAAALTHGGGMFRLTALSERAWPEYFLRNIGIDALAAAVVARLLPANPVVGQLLGVAPNGNPAWTPASGGGIRTGAGSIINLSAANTWAEVQGVGVLGPNQLLLLFLGGRANQAFIGTTGIEAVYGRWVTTTATAGGAEGAANLRFAKLANGNLLWGKQHDSSGQVRTTFLVIG